MTNKKTKSDKHVDADDLDGCEIDFKKEKPTLDEELPVVLGGVAMAIEDNEDLDGCEFDFSAMDPTLDEELPATEGGVA